MTSWSSPSFSRRSFLQALSIGAGGLLLAVDGGIVRALAAPAPVASTGFQAGVYLHIAPSLPSTDGRPRGGQLTVVCHRSEMGQGVRSTIPVILADELGADTARMTVLQADGDVAYGDQNTDGSTSIRRHHESLRLAAATARTQLVAVAAKRWKVKAEQCKTRDHAVVHEATGRRFDFGELADDAAKLKLPAKESVKLRPRAELTRVGTELPLFDGPAYVTGAALYGADVRLDGMRVAVIARPPVVGGTVKAIDDKAARAVKGVVDVLVLPAPKGPPGFQPRGGVAVVAENTWAALRGRAALGITWDHGENASYDSAVTREQMRAAVASPGDVVRAKGDVEGTLAAVAKSGGRILEADYHVPHQAHACMEPPCAVARLVGDGIEVWASTQDPQKAKAEVARITGLLPEKVTVHVTFLGGGFGRKSKADFVGEAAWLARETKVPVRVQWTRDDDLQHDYFHTVSQQRLTAGLDAGGRVVAWRHRTCFPPIPSIFTGTDMPSDGELRQGVLDLPLAIPNVRAERAKVKAQVRIGWLRSVCNIFHAFAVGSFFDELAHARGKDPKENLLELLGPPRKVGLDELGVKKLDNYGQSLGEHPIDTGRHRAVIERVTAMARWDERQKTKGRALGLAVHRSFLTYVAVVAAVVKDARGRLKVDEVWIVTDAGDVMNLERARAQMEGAVVFGMSLALHGAITMKGGVPEQKSFRDYRLVRSTELPRATHVDFIASGGPPGGIGEPGVPPVAPAIANALFALTGERVRDLPIFKRA